MGEVWRATDEALGRTIAVKVLRPTLLRDPGFDARFRAEARTMAALMHPNVVNIYDYGRSPLASGGSAVYLVMAYVDGQPLSERIAGSGRLPVAETMSIVAQAAEALDAAHRSGIIHRDVKPANLLVGPTGLVTLVDFGVARSGAVSGITTANGILGTALYMAPEQASGRPISPATDIYALGAVAYHCLTGQPPFVGDAALEVALRHVTDEPPPLPDDVSYPARMLVERALAKDPADRYPSAAAFAAAAHAAARGRMAASPPTAAVPVPLAEPGTTGVLRPVTRPARSRGRTATLASAAVVLLLGLAGLAVLLGSTRSGNTPATGPATPAASATSGASPVTTSTGPAVQDSTAPAVPVQASPTPSTPPRPSATPPSRPPASTPPTSSGPTSRPSPTTQTSPSGGPPSKASAAQASKPCCPGQ
jgi:serine/threonine-protein kinase